MRQRNHQRVHRDSKLNRGNHEPLVDLLPGFARWTQIKMARFLKMNCQNECKVFLLAWILTKMMPLMRKS